MLHAMREPGAFAKLVEHPLARLARLQVPRARRRALDAGLDGDARRARRQRRAALDAQERPLLRRVAEIARGGGGVRGAAAHADGLAAFRSYLKDAVAAYGLRAFARSAAGSDRSPFRSCLLYAKTDPLVSPKQRRLPREARPRGEAREGRPLVALRARRHSGRGGERGERFFRVGFRLQASGFRLQASGFRLQAPACDFRRSDPNDLRRSNEFSAGLSMVRIRTISQARSLEPGAWSHSLTSTSGATLRTRRSPLGGAGPRARRRASGRPRARCCRSRGALRGKGRARSFA